MALDRRSLLKEGTLAGVLTAGAAALGIANAPAAQAAGVQWDAYLTNLYSTYGFGIFEWAEARPYVVVNEGGRDPWQQVREIWRKDNVNKEHKFAYQDHFFQDWFWESQNWRDYQISSAGLIQIMLNKLVQYSQLGGSYIASDGVIGSISAAKIGDFQTRYLALRPSDPAFGTVSERTWNRLRSKAIYNV